MQEFDMQNCLFIANLTNFDLHLYLDKREQTTEGYFPTSPSTIFWKLTNETGIMLHNGYCYNSYFLCLLYDAQG